MNQERIQGTKDIWKRLVKRYKIKKNINYKELADAMGKSANSIQCTLMYSPIFSKHTINGINKALDILELTEK